MSDLSPICTNCEAPSVGAFCPACGQKSGDLHISLRAFVEDALSTVFSFDNRIARTLIPLLLRPGLVSKDTLNGRRARYVPPMRLYLIVSFAFFLSLKMVGGTITTSTNGEASGKGGKGIINFNVTEPETERASDSRSEPASELADTEDPGEQESQKEKDSEQSESEPSAAELPSAPTLRPPVGDTSPSREASTTTPPGGQDESDPDAPAPKTPTEVGSVGRLIHQAVTSIQDNPERATEILLQRLAWAFFLLPPLAAVWLRFLFRKREAFYVPHLVVSLHIHSAVMLFLTLSNLTEFLPGRDFLGALVVFGVPPYVIVSVHRIYRMHWLSTLWRLGILWILHSIALGIAFFGSMILTGIALS